MKDEDLQKAVNRSGFPLQIAIENLISESHTGWNLRYKEHSWQSTYSKRSGFIDIVLQDRNLTSMVIECKRVQDTNWIFLLPSDNQKGRRHAKVWLSGTFGGKDYFDWYDVNIDPSTPEAEFCIIPGQNEKSPMIERVASEIVESTEALAYEERQLYQEDSNSTVRPYFNAIVTTAELKICSFEANAISLQTGKIDNVDFKTVPVVRFRKSLSNKDITDVPLQNRSPYGLSQAKQHTVFIINSSHLIEFLRTFELTEQVSPRWA